MIKNRKSCKRVLCLSCTLFFIVFTVIASEGRMHELNATSSNDPTFQLYDKVKIGDKEFAVLNTGNTIKLLSDVDTGNEVTWNNARNEINAFFSTLGPIGEVFFQNRISMPLTDDLPIINKELNNNIPNLNKDWWLGDAIVDNRNKFIDKNNRTDGEVTFQTSFINDSKKCDLEDKKMIGEKVSSDFKDIDINEKVPGLETGTFQLTSGTPGSTYDGKVAYYTDHECKTPVILSTGKEFTKPATLGFNTVSFELKNGKMRFDTITKANSGLNWLIGFVEMGSDINITLTGSPTKIYVINSTCRSLEGKVETAGVNDYTYYINASANYKIGSYKGVMGNKGYPAVKLGAKSQKFTEGSVYCPGQTHTAGLSFVRPMIELPQSEIAWGGIEKRSYEIGSQMKNPFPSSNGHTYLTLKTDALNISLKNDSENVTGTTITLKRPANGIIKVPVSVTGEKEGTQYIGVSTEINGTENYSLLKQVDGSNDEVSIDITNIPNYDKLSNLDLTLYVEDEGSYDTSYISKGTNITIVFEEDIVETIPDEWVIVTPDANTHGWNKENVAISLSEQAIEAGYTVIEVINDEGVIQKSGSTITYDNESDGFTPKIRLKKGAVTTTAMPVRTIKIDTTKPSVSAEIEKEAEWAVKKNITIHATDTRSGIDTVAITDPDGIQHTLSLVDDKYIYEAGKEGIYRITVMDHAGNSTTLTKEITQIDTTVISLTAKKETLTTDQPRQKITITYQEGFSGIDSFKVFYKQNDGDYTYLEDITNATSPMDWYAEMNGWFKFELINKAGEKAEAEVEITQVNPPKPVTLIQAAYKDDSSVSYRSDTWTNRDIVLTLSNANAEIKEPVIFSYSEDMGSTWNLVNDGKIFITTDSIIQKKLQVKAKVNDSIQEEQAKEFIVKIDKTKPETPFIIDKENYTNDVWYQEEVLVKTETIPKANNVSQSVYACVGTKEVCSSTDGNWIKLVQNQKAFSGNGRYEVCVKAIDEAGNESLISSPIFVNINNEKPVITISLKNNPIKSLINHLTFGFFYKDSVDIDIDVEYSTTMGITGKAYYVIDTIGKGKPDDDSDDWIEGDHTTLDPQAKAMIYVKAVSASGVVATEDSMYHVYADSIVPSITLPPDMEEWSKDASIDIQIEDAISGVDQTSVRVQIEGEGEQALALTEGKAKLEHLKNGAYAIVIKARDYSSNEGSKSVHVKIDTELPTIQEPIPDQEGWAEQKQITFSVNDLYSGIATVNVKDSTGNVYEVKQVSDKTYQFTADKNGIYTISVSDVAGNISERNYTTENIIGDSVSDLYIFAENKGQQIPSGIWTNEDILFTVSGGLDVDTLEGYQVAITDGEDPSETDWQDMNKSATHQHLVSGNVKAKSYWFRVLPSDQGTAISEPFIVNLDNEKPYEVTIQVETIHDDPISKIIHVLSLGNWMKEEQKVTFKAKDNFTPEEDIRFEYMEETDGVNGTWKEYTAPLKYQETDTILHARAIDLAGNVSEEKKALQIDSTPPEIQGVKDQDVYKKYYYVYRTITYTDQGSGIDDDQSVIKKDGVSDTLTQKYKVKEIGKYEVSVADYAGNETTVHFELVPLPDIETEIDCGDESKGIIDQIQQELDEERENLTEDEIKDYEKWIEDATDKWRKDRNKILQDKDTGTKVEGQGDTSFDPKTELIVEEIPKEHIPSLPRNAIKTYDVYLKKGNTVVQPDGSIKVYLPYEEEADPIVYEIDDEGNVKEIKGAKEDGYVTFITDTLVKYAISNTDQEEQLPDQKPDPDPTPEDEKQCVVGPDGKADTGDDVCGSGSATEKPIKKPDGSVEVPDGGSIIFPNGNEIDTPDGGIIHPDGSVTLPDGTEYDPNGNLKPDQKPDDDNDPGGDGKPTDPDQKPEKECPLEGKNININTDHDGLPDVNVDINHDCKADLNIDVYNTKGGYEPDHIPDLNIDTTGDGKPNINIDTDGDGYADVNKMLKLSKWEPKLNANVNGFAYDTMANLLPDLNVDDNGDGKPDRNIDTDDDGLPDVNVDEDWYSKRGIKDPRIKDTLGNNAIGGAKTGAVNKWTIWWIMLIVTSMTMLYAMLRQQKNNR